MYFCKGELEFYTFFKQYRYFASAKDASWSNLMLTSGQIRAARAFLSWTARDLAERSNVHITTVQRIERGTGLVRANSETIWRIQGVLESAGIAFHTNNGLPTVSLTRTSEDA